MSDIISCYLKYLQAISCNIYIHLIYINIVSLTDFLNKFTLHCLIFGMNGSILFESLNKVNE